VYETYKGPSKILFDVTRPFGKAMFVIHNMRVDKDFFINITNYQAQVNPNKIKEHFENFKRAFYPHLEDFEKKQIQSINKKILKEAEKGVIAFKQQPTIQQQIKQKQAEKIHGKRFIPAQRVR
jgi:hypothetical protein